MPLLDYHFKSKSLFCLKPVLAVPGLKLKTKHNHLLQAQLHLKSRDLIDLCAGHGLLENCRTRLCLLSHAVSLDPPGPIEMKESYRISPAHHHPGCNGRVNAANLFAWPRVSTGHVETTPKVRAAIWAASESAVWTKILPRPSLSCAPDRPCVD